MRLIITILSIILSINLGAQSTNVTTLFHNNYRKAELYYDKMFYTNALDLYRRVLEKNPGHFDSKVKIAECYRILNDPKNAENWYGIAAVDDRAEPIHKYYYAQALASNAKYRQAKIWDQ